MIGGEWTDLKEEDKPISCGFEGEQKSRDAVIIKYTITTKRDGSFLKALFESVGDVEYPTGISPGEHDLFIGGDLDKNPPKNKKYEDFTANPTAIGKFKKVEWKQWFPISDMPAGFALFENNIETCIRIFQTQAQDNGGLDIINKLLPRLDTDNYVAVLFDSNILIILNKDILTHARDYQSTVGYDKNHFLNNLPTILDGLTIKNNKTNTLFKNIEIDTENTNEMYKNYLRYMITAFIMCCKFDFRQINESNKRPVKSVVSILIRANVSDIITDDLIESFKNDFYNSIRLNSNIFTNADFLEYLSAYREQYAEYFLNNTTQFFETKKIIQPNMIYAEVRGFRNDPTAMGNINMSRVTVRTKKRKGRSSNSGDTKTVIGGRRRKIKKSKKR